MEQKRERHRVILDLVRTHRVGSQEALRQLLHGEGIDVTQATLSRDIRELRLVKVTGAEGDFHYMLPEEWEHTPPLEGLLPILYVSSEGTGNFLVVRTMRGGAPTVALAIDWEEWPEVLGTVAGDDTILILLRDASHLDSVRGRLENLAGHETD